MSHTNRKSVIQILSIVLVISVFSSLWISAHAVDSVDSLEQSSSELEQELSNLNTNLTQLEKDITSITNKIEDMNTRIETVKEELALAKGEARSQYTDMKLRIKYMYENGGNNFFEMILSSSNMTDFLKNAEFFSSINAYDRQALNKLVKVQEDIALQENQLKEEQTSLIALQEELAAKELVISQKIDKTSGELANVKSKLKQAKKEAEKAKENLSKPVEPILPPDYNYAADASDLELFAALIECEAGSTNYEGMLAVASVVVNRMNHSRYPDTLRSVIYQSGQFPPAHNGLVDQKLQRGVKESCLQVAKDALAGKNNVGNCLSFRAASSGHAGTIIGDNVFF